MQNALTPPLPILPDFAADPRGNRAKRRRGRQKAATPPASAYSHPDSAFPQTVAGLW